MTKKIRSLLFNNKNTSQTMIKNAFWLSLSQIINRFIKLFLVIYAARILGTEGYGVFSYALSLSILVSVATDLGIDAFVTREYAKNDKEKKQDFSTALIIKLILLIIGSLSFFIIAPTFTKFPDALPLIPLVAIFIFFNGLKDFLFAINRAREKMELEAGIQVVTNIATVIFGVLALKYTGDVKELMGAYLAGAIIGFLLTFLSIKSHLIKAFNSFDKTKIKKIITESSPYALLSLLGIIMINTDILMLSFLKSEAEVGLYSAAQRPIQILYVIPAILAQVLFPVTSKLARKDDKKARLALEQTLKAAMLIGIPIVLGGIIIGGNIIILLFGEAFIEAATAFKILLTTTLIIFPSMIIANTIFAYNKQKSFIGFLMLGVIGNIILNLIFIPKYGIVGSAYATIGAEFVANAFIWIKMKKISYFKIFPYIKKIILAGILMAFGTFTMDLFGLNLILNITTSAIIYFTALKLSKEPLIKEFREILRGA